jgi:hypothetical protein
MNGSPPGSKTSAMVIDGIRKAARAYPLQGARKDELDTELGYFENNAPPECVGSGVEGCGAIIMAPPAAGAAQVVVPGNHVMLHSLPSHDSEPEHPEGPDQTFDGPAAPYSATVTTSHLTISLRTARKLTPTDGGAASTSTVVGP